MDLALEYFVEEEKGKKKKEFGLTIFCPKKQQGEKGSLTRNNSVQLKEKEVGLRRIVQVKGEEERRGEQKRSEEFRPPSGKKNYDRAGFADRLQNNGMLPYHATNRKLACTKHVSSRSQKGNESC